MTLHYILCQSTNEVEFVNGPLFRETANRFAALGETIPYYKHDKTKGKMSPKEYRNLILKAVKNSQRGDIIILWGPGSVFLWFLLRFLYRGRKVMFMNLIFRPEHVKDSFKRRIVYLIYKDAFRAKGFYANVNGEGLPEMYAQIFRCGIERFPIVYDSMSISDELLQMSKVPKKEEYTFCGGRNERDVESFVEIVKRMPDMKFKCIIGKKMVTDEMCTLNNLEVMTDVSLDEFNRTLCGASYCCIPLKGKAPAGLLAMQRAALMGIPIVSTETYSMRTIIPDDEYGFLCRQGDVDTMVQKLQWLIDNPEKKKTMVEKTVSRMSIFTLESVGRQIGEAALYVVKK